MKYFVILIALVFVAYWGYTQQKNARIVSQETPKTAGEPVPDTASSSRTALLANGCFWCVEHDLASLPGVLDVVSGYAGGTTQNPTYQNYAEGSHREVVEVTYDPTMLSFANLVEHIIKHGDPTDANGSFYDRGKQYAPAIYYETAEEKAQAMLVIEAVNAAKVLVKPIAIEILPRVTFWKAEDYHQDYAEKNPIRYKYYRGGSGRDAFIEKYWGKNAKEFTFSNMNTMATQQTDAQVKREATWMNFKKPADSILKTTLTPLQYNVTQHEGTERAFDNLYHDNKKDGLYVDILSGEPLFLSSDKYDSGTGWPSFVKPISDDTVVLRVDNRLFSTRTEVRSRYADSHLGHVFDDGPADRGGKRYCMNSAALRFVAKENMEEEGYAMYLPLLSR